MITSYDIDKKLYSLFKEAVANSTIPITGGVWNGERPLNSSGEDITIRTMTIGGDGFPQNATTNINCYVNDIAEKHGGLVRDGRRLEQLSTAIGGFIEGIEITNTALEIDAITEIAEKEIHQHYINFRIHVDVYANIEH